MKTVPPQIERGAEGRDLAEYVLQGTNDERVQPYKARP